MASSISPPDGFPLLSLHPTLFDKIISKLNGKDYFQLRQTCWAVNDTIQKSHTLCVQIDGNYTIESCQLYCADPEEAVDEEAYYGARFKEFWPPHHFDVVEFDWLFNFLKKHRITCVELVLLDRFWTKEQCIALIKIMKPVKVLLESGVNYLDRYEALFSSITLKNVKVWVKSQYATTVVVKLLPKFEELKVIILSSEIGPITTLRNVLQIFLTQAFGNLNKFSFDVVGHGLSCKDGLEREFREYHWIHNTEEVEGGDEELVATVDLPQHFPLGSRCKLRVNWYNPKPPTSRLPILWFKIGYKKQI